MAISGIGMAIAGIAAGAGSAIGAHETASGAESAANTSSAAANHAADLQSQAAKDALAFQQQQAAQDQSNFNTTQQANYNQWLPKEQQLSSLGQAVGLPARNIPAYVPATNIIGGASGAPASTNLPSSQVGTGYQPLVSALNAGQNPQAVISQFNASQGPAATGESYAWRSIPGAPGGGVVEIPGGAYLAPGPNGVWGYTAAPAGGGGGSTTAAPASGNSVSAYMAPTYTTPIAPALQMPTYNAPSLASYVGSRA